jgi:hypothetical protein
VIASTDPHSSLFRVGEWPAGSSRCELSLSAGVAATTSIILVDLPNMCRGLTPRPGFHRLHVSFRRCVSSDMLAELKLETRKLNK